MPFIPAPAQTIRAVHKISVQGEECLNVCYFDVGAVAPSAGEMITFANDLMDAYEATLFANCAAEATLEGVEITNVTTMAGLQVTSTNIAVAGPIAQAAVNNGLAFLIALNTPFSGRSNRGRLFIPGFRNDSFDADSNYWSAGITSGNATAMQELSEDWLAAVEGLTPVGATAASLVIASYYSGTDEDTGLPIPRAEAVTTGVTSTSARRRVAVQRRRRPRS